MPMLDDLGEQTLRAPDELSEDAKKSRSALIRDAVDDYLPSAMRRSRTTPSASGAIARLTASPISARRAASGEPDGGHGQ